MAGDLTRDIRFKPARLPAPAAIRPHLHVPQPHGVTHDLCGFGHCASDGNVDGPVGEPVLPTTSHLQPEVHMQVLLIAMLAAAVGLAGPRQAEAQQPHRFITFGIGPANDYQFIGVGVVFDLGKWGVGRGPGRPPHVKRLLRWTRWTDRAGEFQ